MIFYLRDAMLTRVLAVVVCLCVRLSIYVSVTRRIPDMAVGPIFKTQPNPTHRQSESSRSYDQQTTAPVKDFTTNKQVSSSSTIIYMTKCQK